MPRRCRSRPSHAASGIEPQRLEEVEHRAAVEPALQRLAQRALLGRARRRSPASACQARPGVAILPPAAHDAADRAEIAPRRARQQRQVGAQHGRRQRRRQIRHLALQRRALGLLRLRHRPLDRIERDLDAALRSANTSQSTKVWCRFGKAGKRKAIGGRAWKLRSVRRRIQGKRQKARQKANVPPPHRSSEWPDPKAGRETCLLPLPLPFASQRTVADARELIACAPSPPAAARSARQTTASRRRCRSRTT